MSNKLSFKDFVKKYIFRVIVIILCIFFLGGVGLGARNILHMEGTYAPYEHVEAASARPTTPVDIVAYLDRAIDKAIAGKPAMNSSEDCGIDLDFLMAEPSTPALMATAGYISDDFTDHVEESYERLEVDYGAGFSQHLKSLDIADSDILSAQCTDEYYRCVVCGEEFDSSDEDFDPATDTQSCPKCEVEEELELRHRDEYTISIVLRDGSRAVTDNYVLRTPEQAAALVDEGCKGFFSCSLPQMTYRNAVITAKVNRITEKISKLEMYKDTFISTALTFEGDYSFLGTVDLSMKMGDTVKYSFTWPELKLSKNEMSMEHGKTEVLTATLSCSDPTKAEVRWSSSDESIATVDEDGYIRSKKLDGKTTITAEFDFQGKTYSESCEVFVKIPVESIDISQRRLTLKVGETADVIAKVSPGKATVQTFKWYTSDAKIATVTADGKITAVGEGAVKVFAVADDGNYKATCKVEVMR